MSNTFITVFFSSLLINGEKSCSLLVHVCPLNKQINVDLNNVLINFN